MNENLLEEKENFPIKVFFLFKISMREKTKLKLYLLDNFHVISIQMFDSHYDFLVEGVFRNFNEISQFEKDILIKFEISENLQLNVIEDLNKKEEIRINCN